MISTLLFPLISRQIQIFPVDPKCPLAGLFKPIPSPGQRSHCFFSSFWSLLTCFDTPLPHGIGGPKYPENVPPSEFRFVCSLAVLFSYSCAIEV